MTTKNSKLVEIVSEDFLKEILFLTPALSAGISKAIDISSKTGFETAFEIQKALYSPIRIYTNILIGSKDSVNYNAAKKRVSDAFRKKYGKSPEQNDPDFIDFQNQLCKKDEGIASPFPMVPGVRNADELSQKVYVYDLFDFHTHPSRSPHPSSSDIDGLNNYEKSLRRTLGLPLRPIYLIASTVKKKDEHDILMFQQKNKEYDDVIKLFSAVEKKYEKTNDDKFRTALFYILVTEYNFMHLKYDGCSLKISSEDATSSLADFAYEAPGPSIEAVGRRVKSFNKLSHRKFELVDKKQK